MIEMLILEETFRRHFTSELFKCEIFQGNHYKNIICILSFLHFYKYRSARTQLAETFRSLCSAREQYGRIFRTEKADVVINIAI